MTRRNMAMVFGGLVALVVMLAAGAVVYLSSESFQQRARAMVTERLEALSGSRVEIRQFRWSFRRMELEMGDVSLHGKEGAGQPPFVHAEHIYASVTVTSLFSRQLSLRRLTIDHPTVHLTLGPRGITTQLTLPNEQANRQSLFDVSVQRLEVSHGQLLLNETTVPFSVIARNVSASAEHVADRYDGTLRASEIEASYASARSLKFGVESGFSASRDRVEIKSSHWTTARSRLDAKGAISDLAHPRADINYTGLLDIAEFASLLKMNRDSAGTLEVSGHAVYGPQGVAGDGKLAIHNGEWRGQPMRLAKVNGGAQYTVEPDRIRLSHVFATVFGGAVSGSAELRNWKNLFSQVQPDSKHPPVGAANLRADALQLRELRTALTFRTLPLDKLALEGRVSGSVEAHWVRSLSAADANVNLDVSPPERVKDGELPVTARVVMAYRGSRETVDVSQLNVATRTTRIDAAGTLGSSAANMRLALNSTDISEFNPVLGAFGETAALAKLNGHASFNGTVAGKLKTPTVTGRLQINDFDSQFTASVLGALPTPESQHPLPVHWDEMVADVMVSPVRAEAHHATLRRDKTRIALDGFALLHDWQFDRNSPLQIRAHLGDVAVADVERFVGRNDPVGGRLTMDLELSGSLSDLRGGGHVQVSEPSFGPEQFSSLTADIRFIGRETQWNNVVLRHDGGTINGTGAYQMDTAAFRFQAAGRAVDLAGIRSIQTPKYKIAGSADFDVSGSGTAEAPVINGSLSIRSVVVNGEPVGDIVATAVTHGADVELKARAHVEEAALDISGTARLRGDWLVNLHVTTNSFDVDPLLRAYLGNRITGHSSMAGTADITGPIRKPRDLRINGSIGRFSAEIEKLRLRNPDGSPIEFLLQDQVLTLKRSHLVAEDTDVVTEGTIQVSGAREMNLRSKGNVSMKLLQSLNPELRASGSTVFDVTIAGTVDRPDVNGPAEVRNAAISFTDVPNGLSSVQGFLQFQHNRLVIESLAAKSGGGNLDIRGFITYSSGLIFDLSVHSSEMRLRYPAGVSAIAAMDLRYAGSIPNSRLSGTVTITRFALNSRFDFAQYLASAKQPESLPQPDSPLSNLHLDVHIVSASELQMQTTSAHLTGNVDLRLRGTAARPVLLGRVNVLEGDISIAGTKYHIDRGDVTFSNPTRIEPVLNVEATARIRDYDVSLGVHGIPPDHLRSSYRSDPPLPESDVIALLALGRTGDETRLSPQPTQNYTETTSNAILGEALNETVSSRAQKLFGLGRIKIDPQAGGPESNPNARLTIEQQVSDKVTLTYITNLSQSSQQIIQVEYNVDRNFTIIAVRDQNGVLGFDVRYRRRKR